MDAGQDPDRFWRTTPREASIILRGAAHKITREHELAAWLAWHVAALSRQEKLPPLRSVMPKAKSTAKRSSNDNWQSKYAAFAAWAGAYQK